MNTIIGRIVSSEKFVVTIKVYIKNGEKLEKCENIKVFCKKYIPFVKNDRIMGDCVKKNNLNYFESFPTILPSKSDVDYINLIRKCFSCNYSEAKSMFLNTGIDNLVKRYFNCGMDMVSSNSFKNNWIERNLKILNLTNKDIKLINLKTYDDYNRVFSNPLSLTKLNLDKCIYICKYRNVNPTEEQIYLSSLSRKILESLSENNELCIHFKEANKYKKRELEDYGIVRYKDFFYDKEIFNIETRVIKYLTKKSLLDVKITHTSNRLSQEQNQAMKTVLSKGFSILTGKAGSGKTSLITELIKCLERNGKKVQLCAPTGKAANRLFNVVNSINYSRRVYTIHRFLQHTPKKMDYIIIDESSMVDLELFYKIIDKYPVINIIMVGDVNQIEPIGKGNIFKQCFGVDSIVKFELKESYRNNKIILNNSSKILNRDYKLEESEDFVIITGNYNKIISHYNENKNCIIITPYVKDSQNINDIIQSKYDKETIVDFKGKKWKLGDKVMMTKNNYNINVMNGESGIIVNLTDDKIIVDFDQSGQHAFSVSDKSGELNTEHLSLCYCITFHKSQGSEWDNVIIYIPHYCNIDFITVNLFYTAVTRGKKRVIIVCDKKIIKDISTYQKKKKNNNLIERLCHST